MDGEVVVGHKPLQVDIGLFQISDAPLPEQARRRLPALVERLRKFSLVEYKGPTDSLEWRDVYFCLSHVLLWRTHQPRDLEMSDVALFVIAPQLTDPFREKVTEIGGAIVREQPGVYRIDGLPITVWVLETDDLNPAEEPVLALFGPLILDEPARIMNELAALGEQAVASYIIQQIQQFRRAGEEFKMHHKDMELLDDVEGQLLRQVIANATAEQRLEGLSPAERLEGLKPEERLEGLKPEERLEGLKPEERLEGLKPEERVEGMSDGELEELRKLLEQKKPRN